MNFTDLKEFLDQKASHYNQPAFVESDPVTIPHRFDRKEDIEIAGFLTATISWGNRLTIINNASKLMGLLGNSPFDFIINHQNHHLEPLSGFVHRTFKPEDLVFFLAALRYIYLEKGGLEKLFSEHVTEDSVLPAIQHFKKEFFSLPHPARTEKHISDPAKGSVAKRINMFLRWMVRNDNRGVDFGLWQGIRPSALSCPLDIHTGNVARKLGLITRKQNDLVALGELDSHLRAMDPLDPVKYDYALFGLGIFEKF
jgi:uncharacterized protein (TIGR02757 family)